MSNPVRIGCCGWSYKDWLGRFYPEGMAAGDYLSFYAEHYPTVEVDSSFYRTPSRKMVQAWRDRTPKGFGFALKVPQTITHEKMLADCQKEVDEFVAAATLLEDKLVCATLQFPYFNKSKFASPAKFLERLEAFLADWPEEVALAVEVRNKNYLTPQLADCLRARGAVLVLTDQVWMPSPLQVLDQFDPITGPFAYLRLLGDRAAVDALTKTLDHTVIDRSEQIRADAEAIRRLQGRAEVRVYVNNHYAGYAHDTVQQLREALES
jgi:uncharacterized protein YecE (DUF72 family)